MIFRQILYRDLGCASYFLADGGEAVVVDPRWDIDVYLELAQEEGVRIAHVLDTHLHADHVSGRERLADRTGACSHRPTESFVGDGPAARDETDAAQPGAGTSHGAAATRAPELAAGDTIQVGSLRLRAWPTPGHRPEHLSIVVTDRSRSEEPWLVLSGDSLLVGDLARPDLAVDAQVGARLLHSSLGGLIELGDHVELWPAHVGGSLCGGAGLSGKTSSTIGYERLNNPLLHADEQLFAGELLKDLPPRPPNLARVVELNRSRRASEPPATAELDAETLADALAAGAIVIDGRPPAAFDEAHIAGAINLPRGRSQGTRAGWVIDPDDRLVVVGLDLGDAQRIATALHSVGLWDLVGLAAGSPQLWRNAGLPVSRTESWDVATLAEKLKRRQAQLLDVREAREWRSGHVPGSHNLPLHLLADRDAIARADGTTAAAPLAVACAAGARAAFAASVIRRTGHGNVVRVADGGVGDLAAHGISLELGA